MDAPIHPSLPAPPDKLPQVGTTIFTVMNELAARHGALNLAQGFPDFDPPAGLLDRLRVHLAAGHHQYAPMAGLPALREALARKTLAFYGRPTDPATEVTITSGATEALFSAVAALVDTGDEVILLDPAYDAYDPAVRLAGGQPIHVPLTVPGFAVDWNRVEDALSDRTRLIVLNSPHNPTGAVLTAADLDSLAALVRNRPVRLLSDEVYEHIIFDGRPHQSLLGHPELAARSLVVSSFGKTYHATGWKIGSCIGPAALTAAFRRVHQFVQFCVVTPMQHALADYLTGHPEHYLSLPAFYESRRDLFCRLLGSSRFRVTPSPGTYFQLADYSAISDEDDVCFARRLTAEHGIAAIPVSVFCAGPPGTRLLRFCFAKDPATLERAGAILCGI